MNPAMMTDDSAYGGAEDDDEAGYFGIAITHDQRVRKNIDRLYRLVEKYEDVADKIEETERKLESLGVDVEDLYDSWDYIEDPDEAYDGVLDEGDGDGYDYSMGGGTVIGHIDDLDDDELEALYSGELTAPLMDFDEEEEEEVVVQARAPERVVYARSPEPDDEDDLDDGPSIDPRSLFPQGTQSGRGFSSVTLLNSAPWVARAKYSMTSKNIAAPISAFAPEARRSLANAASRKTDEPVWIYQQTLLPSTRPTKGDAGPRAITYYVAVGQPAPSAMISKWNALPGQGKVQLVATANGAAKPSSAGRAHTFHPRSSRAV